MRRIGSILMGLALIMSSCTEAITDDSLHARGEVVIRLTQDVGTKSDETADVLPDIGEFVVELTETSTDRLFYRKKYVDAADQKIVLNAGEHRLFAYYGEPDGAGFNSFYYSADVPFEVAPDDVVGIEAVARLSNVKVTVSFGPYLARDHKDYYAKVLSSSGKEITFAKAEERCAYVPVGEVALALYVHVQGKWMYYVTDPVECEAGEFVTFNVETERYGQMGIMEIVIDDGVQEQVKECKVPAEAAPQDGPSITVSGFAEDNRFVTYEADKTPYKGYKADIVSMGGLKSCILKIDSRNIPGVPSEVDLVTVDEQTKAALEAVGVRFMEDMSGKRLAYVDFSGLVKHLAGNVFYRTGYEDSWTRFSLVVTDNYGRTAESAQYTLALEKSEAKIVFNDYDIWAARLRAPMLNVSKGDPSRFVLKLKRASDMTNSSLKTIEPVSVKGKNVIFPDLTGLDGGTGYKMWAEYNGNYYNITPIVSFTTENAWQFPNSDFEQWTEFKHTFERAAASSVDYYWHRPYSGTKYWDVNAKASMPSSGLAATNPNVKCFPCAGRSTDKYSGSYSALIFVVNVGTWNTDNTAVETSYIGQLFIGSADDSGNPTYGTVACNSRPSALKFHYKYVSKNSSQFSAELTLNGSEGVLASGSVNGGAASAWTEMTIPLTYTSEKIRPTDISLKFISTTTDVGVNTKTTIEYNGGSYTGHFGPQLRIDNLRLIYE